MKIFAERPKYTLIHIPLYSLYLFAMCAFGEFKPNLSSSSSLNYCSFSLLSAAAYLDAALALTFVIFPQPLLLHYYFHFGLGFLTFYFTLFFLNAFFVN